MVLPDGGRDVRSGADREDARIVDHLCAQRDDAGTLRDVEVALIASAEIRSAGADTARAHTEILHAIGGSAALSRRRLCARTLGGSRRGRGNATIRRVDDERRPVVPNALGQPALIVVARLRVA